jgi:hypothetical protein
VLLGSGLYALRGSSGSRAGRMELVMVLVRDVVSS